MDLRRALKLSPGDDTVRAEVDKVGHVGCCPPRYRHAHSFEPLFLGYS